MSEWRRGFYMNVLKKQIEDSLKTKEDVINLVNKEFDELMEPVKELSKVYDNEGLRHYQIYDRVLAVDFQETNIKFYQINLGSYDCKEKKREFVDEFFHNGNVFVKQDKHSSQYVQFISERDIDEIFNRVFTVGCALKY